MSWRMPVMLHSTAVSLLFLAACAPQTHPRNYALTAPTTAALVGTYQPTAGTTTLIAAMGKYENRPSSITLHADGQMEITNLPDCWIEPYHRARGIFDSGNGTWTLVRQQQWYVLLCKFHALTPHDRSEEKRGNLTAIIFLVGQQPPYTLETIVTHPDADLALRFEKAATAP